MQNFDEWSFTFQRLPNDRDQHVNADGDPDLRLHRVLARAEKPFDPQVLFDPFEEQFHLPTTPIQVGDGQGGEFEMVGQEHESAFVFDVVERDASECGRVSSRGVDAVECDRRIAAEAGTFIDGSSFARSDDGVLLGADDEEGLARFEAEEAFEIEVAAIQEIEGPGFDGQEVDHVHVVQFSLGNMDETGNASPKIDQSVELDGALTTTKFRPGEEFQAEVDGGGVERVNGLGERGREWFVRIEGSGVADQDVGEVGEDAPIVGAVGIGERAPRNVRAKAGVVAFVFDSMEAGFDVAKTFAVGELSER